MVVRVTNNYRITRGNKLPRHKSYAEALENSTIIKPNAKLLAIVMFLFFFIESSTLGLLPKQFYYVYRNIRISDFLLYAMTIYSFFSVKEYRELFSSNLLILPKLILLYMFIQFIISSILYAYNPVELFFRLKNAWVCFLIFPMLLLFKRRGFGYLVKLVLPVAIVSNVLYILSAVTGVAFLPDIQIAKQDLPGGLKVYRVFGGTFYGELFFLGFVFNWITNKFRLYQAVLAVLFITPHILAFGRNAWFYFTFSIIVMLVWNSMRRRNLKTALRQFAIIGIFTVLLFSVFSRFIPESDVMIESIEARIEQGESDLKYNEGTYGSRMANLTALLVLWQSGNIFFGIGMHPMWVIKPLTTEENIYAWGISDVGWAGVLAVYGLVGLILAVIFQIYFFVKSYKISRITKNHDVMVFLILLLLIRLFFDSVISFSYKGTSLTIFGFSSMILTISALVYKYVYPDEEYKLL